MVFIRVLFYTVYKHWCPVYEYSCVEMAAKSRNPDAERRTKWALTIKENAGYSRPFILALEKRILTAETSKALVKVEFGTIHDKSDHGQLDVHGVVYYTRLVTRTGFALSKVNAMNILKACQDQLSSQLGQRFVVKDGIYFQPVESIKAYEGYAGITQKGQKKQVIIDEVSAALIADGKPVTCDSIQQFLILNNRADDWARIKMVAKDFVEVKHDGTALAVLEPIISRTKEAKDVKMWIRGIKERLQAAEYIHIPRGQDMPREDRINFVLCWLVAAGNSKRQQDDGLPSLFLGGKANVGKSCLTKHISGIQGVSSDATGVGRFELRPANNLLRFNDWTIERLMSPENMQKLKHISSGEIDETKVFGTTKQMKPMWCVVTTNDGPEETCKMFGDGTNHAAAWQRRFVRINWTEETEVSRNVEAGKINITLLNAMLTNYVFMLYRQEKLRTVFYKYPVMQRYINAIFKQTGLQINNVLSHYDYVLEKLEIKEYLDDDSEEDTDTEDLPVRNREKAMQIRKRLEVTKTDIPTSTRDMDEHSEYSNRQFLASLSPPNTPSVCDE